MGLKLLTESKKPDKPRFECLLGVKGVFIVLIFLVLDERSPAFNESLL